MSKTTLSADSWPPTVEELRAYRDLCTSDHPLSLPACFLVALATRDAEIVRLREALGFYADPMSYREGERKGGHPLLRYIPAPIESDAGGRARHAIDGEAA